MPTGQLELIADQVKFLPPNDLVKLIKQAVELLEQKQVASMQPATTTVTNPTTNYASLFGSGKGAFATPAEADNFLRAERNQWEK
ncbi:MAG: hypothetical protein SF097_19795 [Acidobacteriota bacterium]|nr:hypothetical protein [Acidobacteriota bacterium]